MAAPSTPATVNPQPSAVPFPEEKRHLEAIQAMLAEDVRKAEQSIVEQDDAYNASKRYMVENRGELDPHEMFQSELLLKQADYIGAQSVQLRNRLLKQQDSPYFARIDFRGSTGESIPYYIGLFAYLRGGQLHISDWRSPVAGMYYDFEPGKAWYQAPGGVVRGELTRKRQFRIRNGQLEFALESAIQIQDEVLQRELSRTSDEKMKTIIATIQKEQNRIIRNETASTLLIQGVAGSGKTSIALHRVAYLLYRFQTRLTAKNVAIISPNRVFASFIANVLPELGEEPVQETNFADIAEEQLAGTVRFDPSADPLAVKDAAFGERTAYKASPAILRDLDHYIAAMPAEVFEPTDYCHGQRCVPSAWIAKQFQFYAGLPVLHRIRMIAENLRAQLDADNYRGDPLPTAASIRSALKRMLKVKNTLALYQGFYRRAGKPSLLRLAAKNRLEWADVYPYLYLRAAFEGLKPNREVRHLVIDEMQDYPPVQLAVINRIYACSKTLLGDFAQAVNPCQRHTLQDLQKLYPGAETIELHRSYRSTCEIIQFALRFQPQAGIEPVTRHGQAPVVTCAQDEHAQWDAILSVMDTFLTGSHATFGLILKTDADAKRMWESLPAAYKAHWIAPGSSTFPTGICVLSIHMAKGLEFDEVLIPDVSAKQYSCDFDRQLLYVACTRAMHRLTLTCAGAPSPFLRGCRAPSFMP